MISAPLKEQLYDAAFQYKRTKLWKKMADSDLFALRLSTGETGYISILGNSGQFYGVNLYVGDTGLETYMRVSGWFESLPEPDNEFAAFEELLGQNCLQLALEDRDNLMDDEVEEVKAYTRAHNLRLRGSNAYPQFVQYRPGYHPWRMASDSEAQLLLEAVTACNQLSVMLKGKKLADFGFSDFIFDADIPLFEFRNEMLCPLPSIELPELDPISFPDVIFSDQVGAAAIRNKRHSGIYECQLVRFPTPLQDRPEDAPYYPVLLLLVSGDTGAALPVSPALQLEEHPEKVLAELVKALRKMNSVPKEIRCADERTAALLQDFGKKTKIRVVLYQDDLTNLRDCEDALAEEMFSDSPYGWDDRNEPEKLPNDWKENSFSDPENEQQLREIAEFFLETPDYALSKLEPFVIDFIWDLAEGGAFDPIIAARLQKKLRRFHSGS